MSFLWQVDCVLPGKLLIFSLQGLLVITIHLGFITFPSGGLGVLRIGSYWSVVSCKRRNYKKLNICRKLHTHLWYKGESCNTSMGSHELLEKLGQWSYQGWEQKRISWRIFRLSAKVFFGSLGGVWGGGLGVASQGILQWGKGKDICITTVLEGTDSIGG